MIRRTTYFTVSMAAIISFIKPTLLSVHSSPSLDNFRALLTMNVCFHYIIMHVRLDNQPIYIIKIKCNFILEGKEKKTF